MTIDETPFDIDRTLMALADPTRRAILQRLSEGEVRVTELARPFAMSLNAVSKHIRVLERAQLVNGVRPGGTTTCPLTRSRSTRRWHGSRRSVPPGLPASTPSIPCSRRRMRPIPRR